MSESNRPHALTLNKLAVVMRKYDDNDICWSKQLVDGSPLTCFGCCCLSIMKLPVSFLSGQTANRHMYKKIRHDDLTRYNSLRGSIVL